MIFLFTDFGLQGPYLGQMEAVLKRCAPTVAVINLFADAPAFQAQAAAYLLAAFTRDVTADDVVLCVVDPGVGTEREAIVLQADGRWFVGPENGLMAIVARRAQQRAAWRITWRPLHLSASFHGRDLFAPVAAALARSGLAGTQDWLEPLDIQVLARVWPNQHGAVIYIDHYGNAITGLDAAGLDTSLHVVCAGHTFRHAGTFGAAPPGHAFWYENSSGLVEIAVNEGNAAEMLGLRSGATVSITAKAINPV